MKIFSVDAETNGLYGQAIAIAATAREDGKEIASFQGCVPSRFITDDWTRQNVEPSLINMPVTAYTQAELEESFWRFWQENKTGAHAIAHCGHPVETGLFARCISRNPGDDIFSGPCPLHDVGTLLLINGYNPMSVDDYLRLKSITVPFNGSPHHPMYDAIAAALCWEALI